LEMGLLNDNEDFYGALIGRRKYFEAEVKTAAIEIEVLTQPPAQRKASLDKAKDKFEFEVDPTKAKPDAEVTGSVEISDIKRQLRKLHPLSPRLSILSVFLISITFPLVYLFAVLVLSLRESFLDANPAYALYLKASRYSRKELKALRRSFDSRDPSSFYDGLLKFLAGYVALISGSSADGVSLVEVKVLAASKMPKNRGMQLVELFSECYRLRYGGESGYSAAQNSDEMQRIYRKTVMIFKDLRFLRNSDFTSLRGSGAPPVIARKRNATTGHCERTK
jgi:hypothetical protein